MSKLEAREKKHEPCTNEHLDPSASRVFAAALYALFLTAPTVSSGDHSTLIASPQSPTTSSFLAAPAAAPGEDAGGTRSDILTALRLITHREYAIFGNERALVSKELANYK